MNRNVEIKNKRKNCLIVILLLLLISSLVFLYCNKSNAIKEPDKEEVVIVPDKPTTKNTDFKVNQSISIPGYGKQYITSSNQYINLTNPAKNDVYFIYEIFDEILNEDKTTTEISLGKTEKILPAEKVKFNLFEKLSAGTHNIILKTRPYDLITNNSVNGANVYVTVVVTK